MIRKLITSLSLLLVLSFAANAADINGKWKGVIETPDGDFEIFFTFSVDELEVTGTIDTGMSVDPIENGLFKDETTFTFEAYSEMVQQTISYSGTIEEEKLSVQIVGYDMWIDLERVIEE